MFVSLGKISNPFHFPNIVNPLRGVKEKLYSHPLFNRLTVNWKVTLMDCSTVIAVSGVALTLLSGSLMTCMAFLVVAGASAISAFYMRRFSSLSDLEASVAGLKASKEQFENIAKDLEKENKRLSETTRELQKTNQAFQATHQNLLQTNTFLTRQVTLLTLQVTQLKESAERVNAEVRRFQQENVRLAENGNALDRGLRLLDREIVTSRELCEQISNHLSAQQTGLGEQLEQLRRYLAELRDENNVLERIRELRDLHEQIRGSTTELNALRIQYAQERGNFQAIHDALVQLRNQFGTDIHNAVQSFSDNNRHLRDAVNSLDRQINRLGLL